MSLTNALGWVVNRMAGLFDANRQHAREHGGNRTIPVVDQHLHDATQALNSHIYPFERNSNHDRHQLDRLGGESWMSRENQLIRTILNSYTGSRSLINQDPSTTLSTLAINHTDLLELFKERKCLDSCPICYDDLFEHEYQKAIQSWLCRCPIDKKIFHAHCLLKWFNEVPRMYRNSLTCPYCRTAFGAEIAELRVFFIYDFMMHPYQHKVAPLKEVLEGFKPREVIPHLVKSEKVDDKMLCAAFDLLNEFNEECYSDLKKELRKQILLLPELKCCSETSMSSITQDLVEDPSFERFKDNLDLTVIKELDVRQLMRVMKMLEAFPMNDELTRIDTMCKIFTAARISTIIRLTKDDCSYLFVILLKSKTYSGLKTFADMNNADLRICATNAPEIIKLLYSLIPRFMHDGLLFETIKEFISKYSSDDFVKFSVNALMEQCNNQCLFGINSNIPLHYFPSEFIRVLIMENLVQDKNSREIINMIFGNSAHRNSPYLTPMSVFEVIIKYHLINALEDFMNKVILIDAFEVLSSLEQMIILKGCVKLERSDLAKDLFERITGDFEYLNTSETIAIKSLFISIQNHRVNTEHRHNKYDLSKPIYLVYLTVFLDIINPEDKLKAMIEICSTNEMLVKPGQIVAYSYIRNLVNVISSFEEKEEILKVLLENGSNVVITFVKTCLIFDKWRENKMI